MTLIRELTSRGEASLDTDGCHIWNYLYEDDAAKALYLLGQAQRSNEVFNVAGTERKPLRDFVEDIRTLIEKHSIVRYGDERSHVNLNVSPQKLVYAIGEFESADFYSNIRRTIKCLH
jgi:dTDP-D-glucose 4,6-dehydratase